MKISTSFLSISFLLICVGNVSSYAQVHVKGYYRKNGTYVAPHERTSPNSTVVDNYSYPGNYNPNKDNSSSSGYSSGNGYNTQSGSSTNYNSSASNPSVKSLNISDLYLIQKSGDVKNANEFLGNYKGFRFSGSLGKDSNGCETYKWVRDNSSIEITSGTFSKDGKYTPVFIAKYIMHKYEYPAFENSLYELKYKKETQSVTKDGEPFTLWGAENFTEMKLFSVMLKGSFYEVTIVM